MKKLLIFLISGVLISSASFQCKARKQGNDMKLDVFNELGGDFTLTDQDGKKFNLKDVRGNVVLLFFGYTNCPDVCPMTLGKIGAAYKLLGDNTKDVKTLFVTLDPQRDNVARLKKYLAYFPYHPIGLTGTQAEIAKTTSLFKILFVKRLTGNTSGYLFDHSTATFLLDKKGRVRHLFGQNDRPATISTIIKVLQSES